MESSMGRVTHSDFGLATSDRQLATFIASWDCNDTVSEFSLSDLSSSNILETF